MYFNNNNNFYHGIMFHHFHDNGIHTKGQGSISKDDFYEMINFIGRKNILKKLITLNSNYLETLMLIIQKKILKFYQCYLAT